MAFKAGWVLALSYFIAYLKTLAICNFPYYTFVDRALMYILMYNMWLYFLVSFPMFLRIDEKPGNKWMSRVAIDALGRLLGCISEYVKPDVAFPDILMSNNRGVKLIQSKNHMEIGTVVSGSDGGGPYLGVCCLVTGHRIVASFLKEAGEDK